MVKNLFPINISEAMRVQDILRHKIKIIPLKRKPVFVAGVDAAFKDDKVIAVASLYRYPELVHIKDSFAIERLSFPYIPGLLSFREGHVMVSAIKKLKFEPDVIIFDGQGIAHPRGIGIASHIGVILNIPTIGCAKSLLVGEFSEPENHKGSWTYLYYEGKKVGAVLRTKKDVKPVFVSPGHKIDIESSIEIVINCISKYRIPEPIRMADHLTKMYRKDL